MVRLQFSWNFHRRVTTLALVGAAAMVAACSGGNADLQAYLDEVKARPGGRIDPLPQVQPAPSFAYEPAQRRSPFMPDRQQTRVSAGPNATIGPDPNRAREFLEGFSLDTLRMVGTLVQNDLRYGLVRTSDGLIHRVRVGNHLGQNYGRIVSISESQIQLVEIIPDGLGGFIERQAAIALSSS